MQYRESLPMDLNSLGILGYITTVNKQVHSYQIAIISDYLAQYEMSIDETVLANILDGIETACSLSQSLESFSNESEDVQATLISLSIQLANVDSRIDQAEELVLRRIYQFSSLTSQAISTIYEAAITKALVVRKQNNRLFEPPFERQSNNGFWAKIWHSIKSFFGRLLGINKKTEENQSNKAYITAIERCSEIAQNDFSIVCPAYDRVQSACQKQISELNRIKGSFSQEVGLSAEVGKLVAVFSEALSTIAEEQTGTAKNALVQKERSLPDFTISLIGRTKAGKSTLHSVLTNEGKDKIGVGLQRTTRYNRVYQWNLLRLIDTPGIGSAEADGRTDDQIAESVLGESDIICCVIVDDSIQQDILEFIEKIAALNKPIIILLNHKENIEPAPKFKRFVENPKDWLETTGEANLGGHINRILRYAKEKGFDHQITVFPVFLLAALMAGDAKYSDHRETLWKGSNVEVFIEQLKDWIIEAGPIKRSQTLIDETIRNFERSINEVECGKKLISERCNALRKSKPETISKLRLAQLKTLSAIRGLLDEEYSKLANQTAYSFAEENYNAEGDLSGIWSKYLEEIRFTEILREEINEQLNAFSGQVRNEINDVFEDFYYSLYSNIDIGKLEHHMHIDFKSITKILGGLLDLSGSIVLLIFGASNPVGWILAGLGLVVGLISGLFKSKTKKRQEAINRVYQSVKQSIEEASPRNIDACLGEIEKATHEIIDRIDSIFTELIAGLEATVHAGDCLVASYQAECLFLNKVYAWRIIQHLEQRYSVFSHEQMDSIISQVNRIEGKEIQIKIKQAKLYNTSGLAGILSEKVTILTPEG